MGVLRSEHSGLLSHPARANPPVCHIPLVNLAWIPRVYQPFQVVFVSSETVHVRVYFLSSVIVVLCAIIVILSRTPFMFPY